jgi:hypothetical protein
VRGACAIDFWGKVNLEFSPERPRTTTRFSLERGGKQQRKSATPGRFFASLFLSFCESLTLAGKEKVRRR